MIKVLLLLPEDQFKGYNGPYNSQEMLVKEDHCLKPLPQHFVLKSRVFPQAKLKADK